MIWSDFLKNDEGKPSLSNLLKLTAFPFLTYILLLQHTTESMGIYGGLFVVDSAASKGISTYKSLRYTNPTIKKK